MLQLYFSDILHYITVMLTQIHVSLVISTEYPRYTHIRLGVLFRNIPCNQPLTGRQKVVGIRIAVRVVLSCLRMRRLMSGDLDHRRQRYADGLEHGAGASGSGGAQAKPLAGARQDRGLAIPPCGSGCGREAGRIRVWRCRRPRTGAADDDLPLIYEDRDGRVQSRAARSRDLAIHMACELLQQSCEVRRAIGPDGSVIERVELEAHRPLPWIPTNCSAARLSFYSGSTSTRPLCRE
jgi:hypothetical protein